MVRFFDVSITVTRPAQDPVARARRRRAPALRALALSAGGFALTGAGVAHAQNPTPAPAVIAAQVGTSFPVKSVTVTVPSSPLPYGSCTGGSSTSTAVGFPNGTCSTASYTLQNNGNTTEVIDVQGRAMIPSDGTGTPWQLCSGPGSVSCTGTSAQPGTDQFSEAGSSTDGTMQIGTTTTCDAAGPAGNCSGGVAAGSSTSEHLSMVGPSSSSDTSPTFSTSVDWTAI